MTFQALPKIPKYIWDNARHFSINVVTSKSVNTIHIHAKLRMEMRDKVNIKEPSTHHDLSDSEKERKSTRSVFKL